MEAKHLVINFAAPVFFYLSLIMFFMSGMFILAFFENEASFLVFGLVTFLLGYNSWSFAKKLTKIE